MQQMNKDQSSKEEIKAQVVDLTAYIQQWTSLEEEAPTTSFAPPLLCQEELTADALTIDFMDFVAREFTQS